MPSLQDRAAKTLHNELSYPSISSLLITRLGISLTFFQSWPTSQPRFTMRSTYGVLCLLAPIYQIACTHVINPVRIRPNCICNDAPCLEGDNSRCWAPYAAGTTISTCGSSGLANLTTGGWPGYTSALAADCLQMAKYLRWESVYLKAADVDGNDLNYQFLVRWYGTCGFFIGANSVEVHMSQYDFMLMSNVDVADVVEAAVEQYQTLAGGVSAFGSNSCEMRNIMSGSVTGEFAVIWFLRGFVPAHADSVDGDPPQAGYTTLAAV